MAKRIRCAFVPIPAVGNAVMVGEFAKRLQQVLDGLPEESRQLDRIRVQPFPPFGQYLLWEEEGEVPETAPLPRLVKVN